MTSFSSTVTAGGAPYPARIINLSMGGALLDFTGAAPEDLIAVGDRLSLIVRCSGGTTPLAVEGRAVLWNRLAGQAPLLAMQFDEVTGEAAELLEDLLLEALSDLRCRYVSAQR